MSTPVEGRRGKRKLSTWHVLVALAVLLVGGFVTFRLILNAKARKRFDALRAAGYPVTVEELDVFHETPPYGQNAAEYILEAVASMNRRLSIPLFDRAGFPARTEPLGQETQALIAELVGKHEDAFEFVRRAAPIQASRYPVDLAEGRAGFMPPLTNIRNLVRLHCVKAALHAERAEADVAAKTLMHALAVPRSLRREPLIVSQIVRHSQQTAIIQTLERVANRTRLSTEHLEQLQDGLAGAYDPNALAVALAGDACLVLDALEHPRRANLHLASTSSDRQEQISLLRWEGCRLLGLLDLSRLRYANLAAHQLAVARRPPAERAEAVAGIATLIDRVREQDGILKGFVPTSARFMEYDVVIAAHLRVAQTALAVERYRLEVGELPGRLDDLVPVFLDAVPQDPFDRRPLKYVTRPRGYTVYSIGKDRTDDGGTEHIQRRRGPGPDPAYDITFTVER